MDLNLSISNGTVSTNNYDKLDDFDFDIANFPFLDDDVDRGTLYGVYISQLIRLESSHVSDFNCRNKALATYLLKQVIITFVRRFQSFITDEWAGGKNIMLT